MPEDATAAMMASHMIAPPLRPTQSGRPGAPRLSASTAAFQAKLPQLLKSPLSWAGGRILGQKMNE